MNPDGNLRRFLAVVRKTVPPPLMLLKTRSGTFLSLVVQQRDSRLLKTPFNPIVIPALFSSSYQ